MEFDFPDTSVNDLHEADEPDSADDLQMEDEPARSERQVAHCRRQTEPVFRSSSTSTSPARSSSLDFGVRPLHILREGLLKAALLNTDPDQEERQQLASGSADVQRPCVRQRASTFSGAATIPGTDCDGAPGQCEALQVRHRSLQLTPRPEDATGAADNQSCIGKFFMRASQRLGLGEMMLSQGPVVKRSRYLNIWRPRWAVLTQQCLYTFRGSHELICGSMPTERLSLREITALVLDGNMLWIRMDLVIGFLALRFGEASLARRWAELMKGCLVNRTGLTQGEGDTQ